jgi:hypothetical protein
MSTPLGSHSRRNVCDLDSASVVRAAIICEARRTTADRMAAHRKSDQRRDDPCAGGLRKRVSSLEPLLWERGCAPVGNTLVRIDIDAQRQKAVGSSDWLGLVFLPRPLEQSSSDKTGSFALGECCQKEILKQAPLPPRQSSWVKRECA